jgi:hypothetical protein
MPRADYLMSVKAAVALHTGTHRVEELRAAQTLGEAGVPEAAFPALMDDLYRILTANTASLPPGKFFQKALHPKSDVTLSEFARDVSNLVAPCSDLNPGDDPTEADCRQWKIESFFCRVRIAVRNWANPDVLSPGDPQPTQTLGLLSPVTPFNTGACADLLAETARQQVFQPYQVTLANICHLLSATTTVEEFAAVLWNNHATGCSIIPFP